MGRMDGSRQPLQSTVDPESAISAMRRLLYLLPLVVLAAVLFLAVRYRKTASEPTSVSAPTELLRADLELRDGRLYASGSETAFTGRLLERYADGALKSASAVSNGLLEGLSEGWGQQGQLQVREYFRAGVSHGLRTKWHSNGARHSEAEIIAGQLHGRYRHWNEDGTLAGELELSEGQPHGISKAYFPSGFLKTRVRMEHGKVKETESWNDGEFREPVDPAASGKTAPQT